MEPSSSYTKEELLKIINALPISITIITKDVIVALANTATCLFVDKNDIELIGKAGGEAFTCIHHDDVIEGCGSGPDCPGCQLREIILDTIKTNKAQYMLEATMEFKNKGKRYLRISTLPMVLDNDNVVLLSIEDITEARQHEQTKLEKEKLSAVIETAGAVCHEMNQPLMGILGFSELLLMDMSRENSHYKNLKKIKEQVERLADITKKLAKITRYETRPYLAGNIIDIDKSSDKNTNTN